MPPAPTRLTRTQLGLPDGHLFLTTFGYYSSVVRKNPMAVIAAFAQAFAPGEGPALVVKCIDHEAHPEEHARMQALAGEHPDVHLMPGYVDEAEMGALLHHADTVVSLHRAEGFGFVPAQAMAIGKPVIATRYSGNLDYMCDDNAFLVDAEMRPIGPEGAPYPAEGLWAEPDVQQAAALMRRVVDDPQEARSRGAQAERDIAARYSPAAAGATMPRGSRRSACGSHRRCALGSPLRDWRAPGGRHRYRLTSEADSQLSWRQRRPQGAVDRDRTDLRLPVPDAMGSQRPGDQALRGRLPAS